MGNWFSSLPGAIAQGLIWGIMAIGVYITYRILDIADLTVDGSICTGAAVCTVLIMRNINPWLALLCAFLVGLVAGSITGALHIGLGIPAILAGILTQMALWSVNLKILGKANQAIPARSYTVLLSQMDIPAALLLLGIATAAVIGILYLFFGTELGCGIRATGCNPAMSRAQGINTGVNKVIGLALSNGLVALSGGCSASIRGMPISIWVAAPWSSGLPLSLSARRSCGISPRILPCGLRGLQSEPLSIISCTRRLFFSASTPTCSRCSRRS